MTLKQREGDQSLPTVNDEPFVQESVITDIGERLKLGISRYGTGLQPHNGRDADQDLYEELLDAVMYMKQRMLERPPERERIYRKIDAERARQNKMWGQQDHVDFDGAVGIWLPKAREAQRLCENAFEEGKGSWGHIFLEEVAEVFEAKTQTHLKEEIVQVMAVCEAWLEAIDRRNVDPE